MTTAIFTYQSPPRWPRVIRDPVLPERLLAKLWRAKSGASLRTTDGQAVEVIYPGRPAPGHGPDFRDAILKVGPRTLKGPVELHRVPSDWKAHGHDSDRAYDNVVLHVVASVGETHHVTTTFESQAAKPAFAALPTVVLTAHEAQANVAGIEGPLSELAALSNAALKLRLHAAGVARFEERVALARETLLVRSADSTSFARIADGLGYSENRTPFAELAQRVPLTVLRAAGHAVPLNKRVGFIERLLLGGAGLTSRTNEWDAIVGISPMPNAAWRTSGVRPANHPRRRIAALAHYISASDDLGFAHWLASAVDGGAGSLIQTLTVASGEGVALVGEARAKEIAVNAVLPVLAATDNHKARSVFESFPALGGNTVLNEALMLLGKPRALRLSACEQLGLQRLYQEAVSPDAA